MRIPGFSRPAGPVDEPVYLERRPGESRDAFEARLAAAAEARRDGVRGQPASEAYVEGRRDERAVDHERREAARAERRREARLREEGAVRVRRRGGGLGFVGVLVALVAVLGVVWLVLAARQGSFAAGGAVVDQKLAQATEPAKQALDRTGAAVENAGQALQNQGEKIRQAAR